MLDDALVLIFLQVLVGLKKSLNPCCAGRCSSTPVKIDELNKTEVSILVVLDDALVRTGDGIDNESINEVSILVVLDDALVRLSHILHD